MKKSKTLLAIGLALLFIIQSAFAVSAGTIGSSDKGNGTYRNPVIWADVPDLDIIRVGDTYWMSSTTMHMNPGVPIMKSYDLVNWETVSYCYYVLEDVDAMKLDTGGNMYSNGTWASSLRYKDGTFYLIVPSNTTRKTYIYQTEDPENEPWRKYEINQQFHDCGLLMDDDGRNWLVYGNNPLYIIELNETVTGLKEGAARQTLLSNIHAPDPETGVTPTSGLAEGAHIQKIDNKYYIFGITWPSGKPRTEVCHLSDNLFGPYEAKVVAQENVSVDGSGGGGPAQGGIIDDVDGNWYGFVFRDSGSVGRIPWLMPIHWDGKWPMFGGTKENPSHTPLPRTAAIPIQGDFETTSVVASDEFYNNKEKPLYYGSPIEPLETISNNAARSITAAASEPTVLAAVGEELINNGGFETGDTTSWTVNDSATIRVTSEYAASGTYALHVTNRTTTGSGPRQDISNEVVPGGVYQYTAKVMYNAESASATKRFNLCWWPNYNASSAPWSYIDDVGQVTANKGEWTTISGQYTVPKDADASAVCIFLETVYASAPDANVDLLDFYVDDISITVVSEPEPEPEPEPEEPKDIIVNGNFDGGTTGWEGRDCSIAVVEDPTDPANKVVKASGRTATGAGPQQNVTGKMVRGGVYQFSLRVYYDHEAAPATKGFFLTIAGGGAYSSSWNPIKNMSSQTTVTKGVWRTITGTYTVPTDEEGTPGYIDTSSLKIFAETPWTSSPTADRDLFDFYVDDVSITVVSEPEPPAPDDVIVNGGFEEENQGEWVPHLNSTDAADREATAVTITNEQAHSGDYSILTTGRKAVGAGPKQIIGDKLIPGATYEVSAWVKYVNQNAPATKNFQYSLNLLSDGADNWVHMASQSVPRGEWTQLTGTYTVPKNTDISDAYAFIETAPWTSNSNAKADPDTHLFDFYADDMSITLVALPPVGDPLEEVLGGRYTYNGSNLDMAWQWNHNPDNRYWSLTEREGWLRLRTGYLSTDLLNAPNTLTQRTFGPRGSAVIKMDVSHMKNGDVAGLSLFTARYGAISVRMSGGSKTLVMTNSTGHTGHTTAIKSDVETVALTGDTVYLKADADFYGQTDKGYFYYSYDGRTWTQLGNTQQMSYSTGNHFMGYRFAIFNYATITIGGYVDVDYYRISDKLTGATAPTVLNAALGNVTDVEGVAGTAVNLPVSLDRLPTNGIFTEVEASFQIPEDLTVTDVVFADGVSGEGSWDMTGNQLMVTLSGDSVRYDTNTEEIVLKPFATIQCKVNKLQAIAKTVSVVPDYVTARGDVNVVYNVNNIKSSVGLLKAEDGDAWAKLPGYSNPLVTHKFGADPFAMVYNDRVYMYTTNDTQAYESRGNNGNSYGLIRSINIWSSADMVNWTDHGRVMVAGTGGVTTWASNSWAPAAAWKNINGKDKFFLYFCNSAGGVGVLTSDSPTGPWIDPLGQALISRSTPNCSSSAVPWLFDPAVFMDDDGTAYLYFGGGIDGLDANNPKSARAVQLGDDMISIVGTPVEIDAPRLFEDSGMHKYNDVYYYSYCSNFSGTNGEGYPATGTIAYMVSKSPLGPFTYAGEVLPGPGVYGNGDGGNNHHAIFEFNGKYYITYHSRQVDIFMRREQGLTGNGDYRSANISEVTFDSTNRMNRRNMDYEGVRQITTINPFVRVEAETIGWNYGIQTVEVASSMQPANMKVTSLQDGDWIGVGQADFDSGAATFTATVSGRAGGKIAIYLDKLNGTKVGELVVPAGDGSDWQTLTTAVSGVSGVHDLFFQYVGEGSNALFDIDYWSFSNAVNPDLDWASYDQSLNLVKAALNNESTYTAASFAAFKAALGTDYELNKGDASLTDDDIDAAVTKFSTAMELLVKALVWTQYNTKLADVKAAMANEEKYTADSFALFLSALGSDYELDKEDETLVQDDITQAVTLFNQALAKLEILVVRKGLVAHYDMSRANGYLTDVTGNGHNAKLHQITDSAFVKEGDDDILMLPGGAAGSTGPHAELPLSIVSDLPNYKEAFTVEIALIPRTAQYHFLWTIGTGNQTNYLFLNPRLASGAPNVAIKTGSTENSVPNMGSNPLSLTEFSILTVTSEGNSIKAYINGTLIGTRNHTHDLDLLFAGDGNTILGWIGKSNWPADAYCDAIVTDFKVYDTALTAQEISDNYEASDYTFYTMKVQEAVDALELGDMSNLMEDITLPSAGLNNTTITWESNKPSVLGADGKVTMGTSRETVTLTATVTLGGISRTKQFTAYVAGTEETKEIILNQLVLPYYMTAKDTLPLSIAGASIVWTSDNGAINAATGVVTQPESGMAEVNLTATITYEDSDIANKSFRVKVMEKGARYILSYTRQTASTDKMYSPYVCDSMHLGYSQDGESYRALLNNTGVLFAKAVGANAKLLKDPYVFRMKDGSFGILAVRVNPGSATMNPSSEVGDVVGTVMFYTSQDLVSYEEVGLITLSGSHSIRNPFVSYDAYRDAYIVSWTNTTTGQSYISATSDFKNFSAPQVSSLLKKAVEDTAIPYALESNVIPVTQSEYGRIQNKLGTVVNTTVDTIKETVDVGDSIDWSDKKVTANYSDGSTADKAVDWDAEDIAAVDFSTPGVYEVMGTVRQLDDQVENYPFIANRADPQVCKFNGKYYFIATREQSGNNTIYIRESDTLIGLGSATEYTVFDNAKGAAFGYTTTAQHWAPELHVIGGRLYVLFAANQGTGFDIQAMCMQLKEGGDPTDYDDWNFLTRYLEKEGRNLSGSYNYGGITLDMTYFEYSNRHYVVWTQRNFGTNGGTSDLWIGETDPAKPWRLISDAVKIVDCEYGWERNDTFVIEGPYVMFKDDKLYLTYSGGATNETYCVGMVTVDLHGDVNFMEPGVWEKTNYPLLTSFSVPGYYGPGHNSYVMGDDGQLVNVFHGRNGTSGSGYRQTYLRIVHFDADGEPVLDMAQEREILPANKRVKAIITVQAKETSASAKIESGRVKVRINNDEEAKDVVVIAAVYNEKGALVKTLSQKLSLIAYDSQDVEFPVTWDSGYRTVVYMWDQYTFRPYIDKIDV